MLSFSLRYNFVNDLEAPEKIEISREELKIASSFWKSWGANWSSEIVSFDAPLELFSFSLYRADGEAICNLFHLLLKRNPVARFILFHTSWTLHSVWPIILRHKWCS